VFAAIQAGRQGRFAFRLFAPRLEAQDLSQCPVGFEPRGVGGNGGAEAALGAGGVVLGGADGGEAVPGVKRVLRGAGGAFTGKRGSVESLQAVADVGRALGGGEQGSRVPKVAGLAGGLVMRGGGGEMAGGEIALGE